MPLDSELVEQARAFARVAHADHFRKAGNLPYFAHLDTVARLLAAHGYDDDVTLSAAYLHDVLEDRPAFAERFFREMPAEVIEVVEALTETKRDSAGRPQDKRVRFEGYLRNLRAGTDAARRAIPISCADKIDNARSLVEAERSGNGILHQLRTRPGEQRENLAALRDIFAPVVNEALLATFDAAVEELLGVIAAWLPGRAVLLAAEAHLGQFDKAGEPYIAHPLRLWMRAANSEAKMAAVLHDVVEDSDWTVEALAREGIPKRVLRALDHLTRRDGESYESFIERVAKDRLASEVKLLDLADNADLSRLPSVSDADRARAEKYQRAIVRLEAERRKRSLYLVLNEASVRVVRALAIHPDVRGDHVTIAHRVDPDSPRASWLPEGIGVGQTVSCKAVGCVQNARLQALIVELAGSSMRPQDGGVLHVTVSYTSDARSHESNELVTNGPIEPLELPLTGRVEWVE